MKGDRRSVKLSSALAAMTICVLLLPRLVEAHPVSITDTFAYVTRDKVTVRIEVYIEDLYLFHNLQPNGENFLEPEQIGEGIEKHRKFLLERFVIRDVDGHPLAGRSVGVKQSELPPEGVPLADLMAHKISFEMEYSLDRPPEFLTFSQHLVDEDVAVPAEMNLVIKQENAGTPFGAFLQPDQPEIVRFSWDNPPLSPEASEEAWDEWYEQQREETLGITSYSSVYSFLYIDDFEVRHEILVPLLTLEESVLIARDDDAFLDLAEQDAARKQIEAYFKSGNPIEIDGVEVTPVVQRIDFYGLDFKDFAQQAERRPVSMSNARVGIILSYGTKGSPDHVRLTWDRFNRFIWTINVIVYAYDETDKVTLSRIGKENSFEWQNPGRPAPPQLREINVAKSEPPRMRVPIASLSFLVILPAVVLGMRSLGVKGRWRFVTALAMVAFAAAAWPLAGWSMPMPFSSQPAIEDDEASAIFSSLHRNTYRAFDYRDESDIYDALAQSVDGPLLQELYLKVRQGLAMQEQGGAISRVRQVEIVDSQRQPLPSGEGHDPRGFAYRCRWTVDGTVQHWGHVHSRTNQYEAEFVVQPREDSWKITSIDVLDEQRLKFETRLRGL